MEEDLEALVKRFLPRIRGIARSNRAQYGLTESIDDLTQIGVEGLMKAIARHDPARAKLETYAHPWIKYEMLMFARKERASMRYVDEVRRAVDELHERHSDAATLVSVVQQVGEVYCDAVATAAPMAAPEEETLENDLRAKAREFMNQMPAREQEFCRLRYGEEQKPSEIAVSLGLSVATVYRMQERIEAALQLKFGDDWR